MDILSHYLTGRLLATTQKYTYKQRVCISFFGFLPDVSQLLLYPLLVWILPRPYYFPANDDWIGVAEKHPWFTFAYEFPHSIPFMMLFVLPFIWYFQLPKMCLAAYFSHLLLDIPTHTGEWSTKIFCPSQYYYIEGFTDAWAWGLPAFSLCWMLLTTILLLILYYKGELMRVGWSFKRWLSKVL
ncbi:MAG: hypothetical protein ACKVTZ_12790 [Bacteroidia bacterium]